MTRRLALAAALALAACATPNVETAPGDDDATAARSDTGSIAAAADLVGLTETAVAQALGAPDRRRPEGDVAVWRYDSALCVVEMFFYPDGGSTAVRFAEARDRNGAAADEAACFDALRERRSLPS